MKTYSYTITVTKPIYPRHLADMLVMQKFFADYLVSVKDNQRSDHCYGDTYQVQEPLLVPGSIVSLKKPYDPQDGQLWSRNPHWHGFTHGIVVEVDASTVTLYPYAPDEVLIYVEYPSQLPMLIDFPLDMVTPVEESPR